MEYRDEQLKQRIMRRVYAVWFWRSVAPILAVELVLLSGVAVGVLTHISLKHVFLNALSSSSGLDAFVRFFIDNFFVKSIQSRLLVVVYALLAIFFIRDLRVALRRMRSPGGEELSTLLAIGGNRR